MVGFRNNKLFIVLFIAPAFLIVTFFEMVPVLSTIYFSFHDWPGIASAPLKFVGWRNYGYIFQDEQFLRSLRNVLSYVFWSVIGQVGLGFTLALMIYHVTRGTRFYKASFFLPLVLPATSVALIWYFILFPTDMGVVNHVLDWLGLDGWKRAWLVDKSMAMPWIIVITTWTSIGYYTTIGLAALSGLPDEVLEAAQIDGAVGLRRIWSVIIPMIWESIKISVVLVITGVLKIFDIIFILTDGGPNGATHVPATLLYKEAFEYNNYGGGSAIATVIFLLSITLSLFSLRVMRSDKMEA
jgi:raffinose/stachyose/melibiose transport system permease protein